MYPGIRIRRVLFGMESGLVEDALSDERYDSRLLIPAGMFFVVIGGWLLSPWMYCSVVLGFVKGELREF